MENATKALLISASVLIAIIIIAIGIRLVGIGKGSVDQVDDLSNNLTSAMVNSQFESFEGKHIESVKVKQLVRRIITYNEKNSSNKITVIFGTSSNSTSYQTDLEGNVIDNLEDNKTYKVSINDFYGNGLISSMKIIKE